MDDDDKPLNTEEEIIYEIVEDIISTENKISEISQNLTTKDTSGPGLTQCNLKNEITKNLSLINSLSNERTEYTTRLNQIKLKHQLEVQKIETSMKEIEQKLQKLTKSNNKGDLYKLNYEKVEEIITKKKNEDDLRLLSIELNSNENLQMNILSTKEGKINKSNEIKEKIKMLKEEKLTIQNNIVNLISQKESYEEMIKLSIGNSKNCISNNNNSVNTSMANSNSNLSLDLYHYEICQIDIIKTTREITEILMSYIASNNNNNTNNYANNDNDNENQSLSTLSLIKIQINNILKKEITSFINLNHKLITNYKVSTFLSNLTNKVITISQIANVFLSHRKISDFIKNELKVNYYEKVIQNEMNFLNKDYKIYKKELKKDLDEYTTEVNNLSEKEDEVKLKLEQIKQKEKILINYKTKNLIHLSPEEREFIILNEKYNILINNKKQIQYENTEKEGNIQLEIKDLNRQINELNNKNKHIELGIEKIEDEIKNKKGEINDTIVSLQSDINEKFKLIKVQLSIFKKKHGKNNMNLYNTLVERINNTLKKTSQSSLYHHGHCLSFNNTLSSPSLLSSSTVSTNRQSNNNALQYTGNNLYLNQSASTTSFSIYSPKRFNTHKNQSSNIVRTHNNSSELSQQKLLLRSRNIEDMYNIKKGNGNNNNNNQGNIIEEINNRRNNNNNNNRIKCFQVNIKNNTMHNNINIQNVNSVSNNQKNKLQEEKEKLFLSIKNFKQKIENNVDREEVISKISPMLKNTNCYYRNNNDSDIKFNPLYHSSSIDNFNFTKITLRINDQITHLILKTQNNIIIKFPLEQIENTIVSNSIKFIIKIYQKYKHKEHYMTIDDFINSKDIKEFPLSYSDKAKAAVNQKFNFFISLNNKQRYEFVVNCYDDIKKWLNGLGYIIKYKGGLPKLRNCFNVN